MNVDAIECLLHRVSVPKLTEPGPNKKELQLLLKAALRAPDHAALRPWKIVVIEGEGRQQIGRACLEHAITANPELSSTQQSRSENLLKRAPLVIAVAASPVEHPKVPEVEQLLSAGAAAQNLMLMAHALGYGAVWRTGEYAYAEAVRNALGLAEHESVVGFIYIGSADMKIPDAPEHNISDFVSYIG
jgi:nitroreductase